MKIHISAAAAVAIAMLAVGLAVAGSGWSERAHGSDAIAKQAGVPDAGVPDASVLIAKTSSPWPPPKPPCRCRAHGRKYELGAVVCIKTSKGHRRARCEMALNNTTWTFLDEPCGPMS